MYFWIVLCQSKKDSGVRIQDSAHVGALGLISRIAELTGDLDLAIERSTQLASQGVNPTYWIMYKGILQIKTKRYREAQEAFDQLIEITPGMTSHLVYRAQIHRRLKDYANAIADFTEAINLTDVKRREVWYLYHRATSYWITGQHQKAVEDFETAFEYLTYPTYANVRLYLVLREMRRDDDAAEKLRVAREDNRHIPWLSTILSCFAGEITPEELISAAETPKEFCEGYYYAGEAYLLQGRKEAAEERFRLCVGTGLDTDPETLMDPMTEYELAEWRLEQLGES